jgi:hypothetical protein
MSPGLVDDAKVTQTYLEAACRAVGISGSIWKPRLVRSAQVFDLGPIKHDTLVHGLRARRHWVESRSLEFCHQYADLTHSTLWSLAWCLWSRDGAVHSSRATCDPICQDVGTNTAELF